MSTPRDDPVADPPESPGHIAPSLAEEPADDVLRATPDFATASRMFEPGSARRRAFNTYSMHAIARDPKAMRGFLIASGMNLDTPVSEIISRGWQAFVPEVQWHIAVEVLVPAWLARGAGLQRPEDLDRDAAGVSVSTAASRARYERPRRG